MKKTILTALINSKKAEIACVQEILSEYAGIVKTRLGIHDAVIDKKSECAFLIIELAGAPAKQKAFYNALKKQKGVCVKLVNLVSK